MSEQTSRLSIILDSSGAEREADSLAAALNRLTQEGSDASSSTDELSSALKGLAASAIGMLSISAAISSVDDWGQMAARIKMALNSVEGDISGYIGLQERFLSISNRNGKDISITQELYVGAATSMKELGYSTSQTADYVESLSSSFTANATSSAATESAIGALNKSMVTGKVSGLNWISVTSAIPSVLGDIAAELERTNGGMKVTENQVKKMGMEGKVSFQLLADSVMKARDANNALADSMDNTVADGITRVINSTKSYYGELNQSIGITRSVSAGLASLSDNFKTFSTIAEIAAIVIGSKLLSSLGASIKAKALDVTASSAQAKSLALAAKAAEYAANATVRKSLADKGAALSGVALAQVEYNVARGTSAEALALDNLIAKKTIARNASLAHTQALAAEASASVGAAAASRAASVPMNLAKGALGLIGGPAGLAMIAAGGMYYLSQSMQKAKDDAVGLSRGLDGLVGKLRDMTREQKQIKLEELTNSISKLSSVELSATIATSSAIRELKEKESALNGAEKGTRGHERALKAYEAAEIAANAATAKMVEAQNDKTRAEHSAAVIQAELNGKLLQGVDLLSRQHSTLPNAAAAWKSFGLDVNAAANAMGKFNAESLKVKYSNDDVENIFKDLKRQAELSTKSAKDRSISTVRFSLEDKGASKDEIKRAEAEAAIIYDNTENQRKSLAAAKASANYTESAAQKTLSQLKEQYAVLLEQESTGRKVGSNEQARIKWIAELADIEDKKNKGKLTADQKSLLASKDLITTQLTLNAAKEKALKTEEDKLKIMAYQRQLQDEVDLKRQSYEAMTRGYGLGNKEQQQMQARIQLQQEYQRKQKELDDNKADKSFGMTEEQYQQKTQDIQTALNKQLSNLESHYADMDTLEINWQAGISHGWRNFVDDASNYSLQAANVTQQAMGGLTGAMADMLNGNKNAWKDWSIDVLKMIEKVMLNMLIVRSIGGLSSMFMPSYDASNVFSAGIGGLKLFSSGGYTGDGGKYDPKGTVHGGEFVFTKDATDRIGVDNLYKMMNSGSVSTNALSSDAYAMKNLHPANQTTNTNNTRNENDNSRLSINVGDINIDSGGQSQQSTPVNSSAVKREFQQMVESGVNTLLRNPASALSREIKGK